MRKRKLSKKALKKALKKKTKKAVENMNIKPEISWLIVKTENGYKWRKTERSK